MSEEYIFGIRAVMEAIEAGKDIDRVYVKKDLNGELAGELFEVMRKHHIVSRRVPIERINKITRKNHQGVVAMLSAVTYYKLDRLIPELFEEGKLPFMVVLDGVTDVRNFGGIARTCECAGVDAIVIPEHDSVGVTADAVKTSAGALHYIPVCREGSVLGAVRQLKASGYTVIAVTEKTDVSYTSVDYTVPVAIVLGAEDRGISAEVLRVCDSYVSIPMFGHIGSLNVGVAAAIVTYESVRQRCAGK